MKCDLEVAKSRNMQRSIPIPHSTIERMAGSMELPEPDQHAWERPSVSITNDGLALTQQK